MSVTTVLTLCVQSAYRSLKSTGMPLEKMAYISNVFIATSSLASIKKYANLMWYISLLLV